MESIEAASLRWAKVGDGPSTTSDTRTPRDPIARARSSANRHTPPTASAVIKTCSTLACGMPGRRFEGGQAKRPRVLDVAEFDEVVHVVVDGPLPRRVVRPAPPARVVGRPWIREQRHGLVGPDLM